jgi:glycosyltransferase involved in cell wall biosynthesis
MPRFSVIIPVYNRVAFLCAALDSVFRQTFTDYEVIVVDDGSSDDILSVVTSYRNGIRFFRQENNGPGTARNLGIQNAAGEYVAFLDSDDVWFPWTLACYHEAIQQCKHPDFITGNCLTFSQLDQLNAVQKEGDLQYKLFLDYYAAWQECTGIVGCGVVVKTTAIARTGGFLSGRVNAEDSDMWLKLGVAQGFCQLTSPPVFGYRETMSSVSKNGAKTAAGYRHMVLAEKTGAYPGGVRRRLERWQILTRHMRPASLGCLKEGNWREAWWFYRQSLWWNISLGRFRYLLLLPLLYLRRRCLSLLQKKS